MFDNKTYDEIMEEMLSFIPDTIDKREGSLIWDALSPCALELAQAYVDLAFTLDECFADTASYYYLIKICATKGIFVKEGTPAKLKIEVTPSTVEIDNGIAFNIATLNYTVTRKIEDGYYEITCDEAGIDGNNTSDDVIPMSNIDGLEAVKVVDILESGTDDESEEELRDRYFRSFQEVSFGGNIAQYKEYATNYGEVKGCKVIPIWNGAGTVKLIIVGDDYLPASTTVIDKIQNEFDPTPQGTGVGLAPIGHTVTVTTPTTVKINVDLAIKYMTGYSWNDIKDTFKEAFNTYLGELRESWQNENRLIIRTGKIEEILLTIPGVDDITNVSINGSTGNYAIENEQIPIGGVYNG